MDADDLSFESDCCVSDNDYEYPDGLNDSMMELYNDCCKDDFYNDFAIGDVFFMDNCNLDCFEEKNSNFAGTICVFRDANTDWRICIAISLSVDWYVLCPLKDYAMFRTLHDDSFCLDHHVFNPIVIRVCDLLNNSVNMKFLNQLSGVKPYDTRAPALQFANVWDLNSSFVCASTKGPDMISYCHLLNPKNCMIKTWYGQFRKRFNLIPPVFKSSDVYKGKNHLRYNKKGSIHPFDYQLSDELNSLH